MVGEAQKTVLVQLSKLVKRAFYKAYLKSYQNWTKPHSDVISNEVILVMTR